MRRLQQNNMKPAATPLHPQIAAIFAATTRYFCRYL
jgi:hypothetical protein